MKPEIKQRIAQIKAGQVPDGYKRTKVGIVPTEWQETKLSHYLTVNNDKNEDLEYGKEDVFSISGELGIVNQIELLGRSYAGASVAPYGIVYPNDIVYTKSPLKANPYGIIKTNKTDKAGIVSTLYAIFHCKDNVCPDFVQLYFESDNKLNNYLYPIVNIGAKHDMKISDENSLKGYVVFPSLAEQEKIAEILSAQDKVIALKEKLLEEKKKQKSMIMDKIFSIEYLKTKSSTLNKVKIGDICRVVTDYVANGSFKNLKDNVKYLDYGYAVLIRLADYNNKFDKSKFVYIDENAYKFLSRSVVYPGDIIIANVGSVGSAFRAPDLGIAMSLAPNAILVRTNICDEYFYQFICSSRGQELLKTITSTTAQPKFNKTDFKGLEIFVPDTDTQVYISKILKIADEEIELLQKELDQEKQKKKALMQLLLTGIVRV